MFNNFIGGGQVFLHKIRMFMQVFWRNFHISILVGSLIGAGVFLPALLKSDLSGALTYRKAALADGFDQAVNPIRHSLTSNKRDHVTTISVYEDGYSRNLEPYKVMKMPRFKQVNRVVTGILGNMLKLALIASLGIFILIFLIWWKFGKSIQTDQKMSGGAVLTDRQVSNVLRGLDAASDFKIGKMHLVKNMETRHFLITGSTGSGKTNFIDNLLPQVEEKKQPAIVIDQTGEMIAKYYNAARGDIIFNPFDARSHEWDFWADCFDSGTNINGVNDRLEKFAKILFSFNRKNSNSNSDPFWENSAEVVFTSCAQHLFNKDQKDITALQYMLQKQSFGDLARELKQTPASRYLNVENKLTANSILSVMSSSTKPLNYLAKSKTDKSFSLIKYLQGVKEGKDAWLFLATKPSQRELTLPLVACLTELAVSLLMENGICKDRKLWFVLDELAALGKLPALGGLMSEGRKYGACVVAAMQSLNQLYLNYGQYGGSAIFGQFGSKFFFLNDEPQIAKMISDMCGTETINNQQKNTSFGANEFRDGVSYTEQERQKKLVEYNDVASLDVGECYVLLPESKVRLAKIKVPESKLLKKNHEFEASNEIRDNSADTGREEEWADEHEMIQTFQNQEFRVEDELKPEEKEDLDKGFEFEGQKI